MNLWYLDVGDKVGADEPMDEAHAFRDLFLVLNHTALLGCANLTVIMRKSGSGASENSTGVGE